MALLIISSIPGEMDTPKRSPLSRVVSWALVAVYTIVLPHAIMVYKAIEKGFSAEFAGKVPLAIIILSGLAYLVFGFSAKKGTRCLGFTIPCAMIVYIIVSLEPNPNKHIHIPEYVLMSWLLFEAISIDYRGKGILLLVVICSSMLGIVDELEQGIYQNRFYGWTDMVINSASSVIGVLALMGVRDCAVGDWGWRGHLRHIRVSLGILLFGAIGAVFMCVYLFHVKEVKGFWGVYPIWLLVWNCLYLTLGSATLLSRWHHLSKRARGQQDQEAMEVTAHLWVVCPLAILLLMHALVVLTRLTGWEFG
jgi:VanZ family protein